MLVHERNPHTRAERFDSEKSLAEARSRLPFERLIQEHGHGPDGDGTSWKSFTCPFCRRKKKAGLFEAPNGVLLLKCMSTSCPTGAKAMDEVGFLARVAGLGRGDAFREYLKAAGVWEERARFNSTPEITPEIAPELSSAPTPQTPAVESPDSMPDTPAPPQDIPDTAPTPQPDPSASPPEAQPPPAPEPKPTSRRKRSEPEKKSPPEIPGLRALREFYSKLVLSEVDEQALWDKRGLLSQTSRDLGLRSNPRTNAQLLKDLATRHEMSELLASGLWLASDLGRRKPRRVNNQYCGYGISHRKPESQRRHKDDKWVWGWTDPVLIPYCDLDGSLGKLRPHKGGAPSGTAAGRIGIYVPRVLGAKQPERFERVVICEGEFKAAALWQMVGARRVDGEEAWGVCSLPGITFGRTWALRAELDDWLKTVGAREVVVAFDSEDKSDRPLRQRHEAMIWARYLATDLKRSAGVAARVCLLPKAWRTNGKADWDGALSSLLRGGADEQTVWANQPDGAASDASPQCDGQQADGAEPCS